MAEKISFVHFSNYQDQALSFSDPGSPFEDDYGETFDENGIYSVVKIGEHNIQDLIDSYKDDVDIYKIIARVGAGDLNALNRVHGSYMDISDLPDNIHEAVQTMRESQLFFDRLPANVRSQFQNNFRRFVAAYGTPDFMSIFQPKSENSSTVSAAGNSDGSITVETEVN